MFICLKAHVFTHILSVVYFFELKIHILQAHRHTNIKYEAAYSALFDSLRSLWRQFSLFYPNELSKNAYFTIPSKPFWLTFFVFPINDFNVFPIKISSHITLTFSTTEHKISRVNLLTKMRYSRATFLNVFYRTLKSRIIQALQASFFYRFAKTVSKLVQSVP